MSPSCGATGRRLPDGPNWRSLTARYCAAFGTAALLAVVRILALSALLRHTAAATTLTVVLVLPQIPLGPVRGRDLGSDARIRRGRPSW
ncbi:hypothetical protein JL475_28950 [Streptomyces sp. M2CJ-2]|uniref:hypothetical protein n=1 Tax=Streptomyces sp. M2CJ-2 TaxID=2803948 RepID=UPI001929523E|nr:hypothetical protein [Streptomyces sp. M2CJ-2]MBL3669941.1 hypothetical protein [Streptomyces sp. M2CJ-2]